MMDDRKIVSADQQNTTYHQHSFSLPPFSLIYQLISPLTATENIFSESVKRSEAPANSNSRVVVLKIFFFYRSRTSFSGFSQHETGHGLNANGNRQAAACVYIKNKIRLFFCDPVNILVFFYIK